LPLYADQLTDDQVLMTLLALTLGYDPLTQNENWRRSGAALAGEAWSRGLLTEMILAKGSHAREWWPFTSTN
jgi:hypothetical protein